MTVLTTAGQNLIAAATAGDPLVIDEIAVGDGDGAPISPDAGMTALINERARVSVSEMVVTGNVVRFRAVFVPGATEYTIREAGLFADGTLVAVTSLPQQDMPDQAWATAQAQSVEFMVTIGIVVTDTDTVTVNVDTSQVFATISYVDNAIPTFATIQQHIDGVLASRMAHPQGVKATLDAHRASNSEHPGATTVAQGFARYATVAETETGQIDNAAVTPVGLAARIAALLGGASSAGNTLKKLEDLIASAIGSIASLSSSLAALALGERVMARHHDTWSGSVTTSTTPAALITLPGIASSRPREISFSARVQLSGGQTLGEGGEVLLQRRPAGGGTWETVWAEECSVGFGGFSGTTSDRWNGTLSATVFDSNTDASDYRVAVRTIPGGDGTIVATQARLMVKEMGTS